MKLKFWESKKIEPVIETKSANPSEANRTFVQFLQDNDHWDLSFAVLVDYSRRCSPFKNAVDIIAEAVAAIPLRVRDKKTGEFIDDHPVLQLLEYPNNTQSYDDWIIQLSSMFSITGNPFIRAVGGLRRPPISLDVLNPAEADPQPDMAGELGSVQFAGEFNTKMYRAQFDKGRSRLRAGTDDEIWPVFAFNPRRGSRHMWGTPIAQPLYYEIEQYINAGLHNKTLLKRGARPGGIFTANSQVPLTDEQVKRFQDQIDVYYMGANNAGRPLFGEHIDYKESIVNNRDMDFKTVIENASEGIYKQFKIPLPLVSQKASTFGNYETAQVAVYDRAVLPHARFLFRQMTMALMYRFEDDWRRYEFAYNIEEIEPLQLRRNESVKIEKDIAVSTVNELRSRLGMEPLPDGDVILRPASDVPALDNFDEAPDEIASKTDEEKRMFLESATRPNGEKRFTPEQIDAIMSR